MGHPNAASTRREYVPAILTIALPLPPTSEDGRFAAERRTCCSIRKRRRKNIVVQCCPKIFVHYPEFLDCLVNDIEGSLSVLPVSVYTLLLERISIWINYTYDTNEDGRVLEEGRGKRQWTHTTTHHRPEWLIQHDDNPRKAPGIEIYDARHYVKVRTYWNGYGLLLHEFCHIMHQFVLDDGLNNRSIIDMHHKAKYFKHPYQCVIRRDWLVRHDNHQKEYYKFINFRNSSREQNKRCIHHHGKHESCSLLEAKAMNTDNKELYDGSSCTDIKAGLCCFDVAYAILNEREYFAELSVAYLCKGYRYLNIVPASNISLAEEQDKNAYYRAFCPPISPPLLNEDKVVSATSFIGRCFIWGLLFVKAGAMKIYALCLRLRTDKNETNNQDEGDTNNFGRIWHCNKCYPFTRHQLAAFDPEAYTLLLELWHKIEHWEENVLDCTC